jgi:N-acetylmuramoyl-L-alanine amidase
MTGYSRTIRLMKARTIAVLFLLATALLGRSSSAAAPDTFEIKARDGSRGRLPRVVVDDGAGYVSAARLAALLKGSWIVKGARATLIVGKRSARFSRDHRQAVVAGRILTLDSAARVGTGGWLLPEDFLTNGLARLAPGITAAAPVEVTAVAVKSARTDVTLADLRYRSYPSFTRIVVEAKSAIAYVTVPGSQEIRVRLLRLALDRARAEEIADGLVKDVRLDPEGDAAVLRVSLLERAGEVKTATLQDPFRVVLDIYRRKPSAGEPGAADVHPLRLIVLDAGHGGHDPGATGPSGVMEKDVVLDVTKRVSRLVEEGLGVKTALTRSTDVFIPLRERTSFASRQRADLFVSIHANAHPQAASEGVEVYFLSSEASDSQARHTAALENEAIQFESPASRQKSDLLKSILWDMSQSEFQQESSVMAETVLDSMTRSLKLVPRGVKQAGFYVLGGAPMPAILIEIGFVTNRKEERKLATPQYREALARAIYSGLAEYKRRYDQRVRTARTAR